MQPDQPADDWAGLAQNLFGINLDKGTGDDDLLDDDMFKVELPKSPEPHVAIPQSEVEFAPAAESEAVPLTVPSPPVVAKKPPIKTVPQPLAKASVKSDDDSFGFGIVEAVEVAGTLAAECSTAGGSFDSDDDGLTLPDDYDAEGLTLPADYDDGLTLAPESIAASVDVNDGDEDEESDTEVLTPDLGEVTGEGRPEPSRRKNPRRTREDAYWDMLENWEWEEIPDSDSPRGEGERPRTQRGDRGDRGGRGGDRGRRDRGPAERPRSENRSPSEQHPPRVDRRPAESAPTSGSDAGERSRRPRSEDRPARDGGGPRADRPRSERRPERDERRPDEPRRVAPANSPGAPSNTNKSAAPAASGDEDFGSGIFDEQPRVTVPSSRQINEVPARQPREESVAQSSQAADAVLRDRSESSDRSIDEELVWPDDDSDVRSATDVSVVETAGLPPADAAGESDEMVLASDVVALDEGDAALRPPRRRRRRREPRSESRAFPPDGNEGTTFDLSDALAADSESPDFIPSAVGDDSAMSDGLGEGSSAEGASDEDRSTDQRGVRRRRRRRRPGEGPAGDSAAKTSRGPSAEGGATEFADEADADDYVVKPITYSNIPSWEEAIKYLLQPQLVGRNLGPEDADESLENDPRGSGGAEPTPPPPPQRRSGGRGGRGRRP